MHIIAESFWLPKQGHTPQQYEDAYYPLGDVNQTLPRFRCAVADGATEASFADKWAQLLVKGYCEHDNLQLQLPKLQQQWYQHVKNIPLPWYAEAKLSKGAFATLIGLTLYSNQLCQALAMGDSCLFHLQQTHQLRCFPLTDSQQFDNQPPLLASADTQSLNQCVHLETIWQPGDEFYLMTDALAYWFLSAYEQHHQPWQQIQQLTQKSFKSWIAQLRAEQQIANDDVTVLRVIVCDHHVAALQND